MHRTLWYVVLVCHQYEICCKNYVGSVYGGGYGGLSESGLYVFRELCPVGFLIVVFVLVCSRVLSYVDCGDDGYVV